MTRYIAIDVAVLRKMLAYDPETGVLTWLERPTDTFANAASARAWNARSAGKPAFVRPKGNGYIQGTIFDRNFLAHRVAWAIHYGEWPVDQLDHINGDRTDNRISNLRGVDNTANNRNKRLSTRNKSGVSGVNWDEGGRRWSVTIGCGRTIYLGRFVNFDDAVAARRAAEIEHGFHPNHGRAA